MKHQTKIIDSFCFVTDYVANGSFASLKQGVTYRNKPDYAILVRVTDFTKKWNGNYVWVDKKSYDFLNKSSLIEGDLIIANVGETGKCFIVPNLGQPMTLGPNSILVRPQPETCNTKYLYYYLSSEVGRAEIEKISSATTQSKFNKTSFRKLEIPLPPLHKQEQIADTLDKADALHRKDQELLQKYDELAQAIFHDMFGDPVRNERGWEVFKIKDAGTVITGSTPPSSKDDMFGGSVPFITPGDLESDQPVQRFLTDEGAKHSRTVPAMATLVCCIGATIGKTGMTDSISAFNQQINAIVWDNTYVNPTFGAFMMGHYKNVFRKNFSSATTLPIINKSTFQSLEIIAPSMDLQNKFELFLKKLVKLKNTKRISLNMSGNIFSHTQQRYFS